MNKVDQHCPQVNRAEKSHTVIMKYLKKHYRDEDWHEAVLHLNSILGVVTDGREKIKLLREQIRELEQELETWKND